MNKHFPAVVVAAAMALAATQTFAQSDTIEVTPEQARILKAKAAAVKSDPSPVQFRNVRFLRGGFGPAMCAEINAKGPGGEYTGFRLIFVSPGRPGDEYAVVTLQAMANSYCRP